ncbi:MAG: ammonia channel protein, partial [Nitrospirota bacterium]|nr:ammonia channel protein [Nitrospirota bacterium]
MTTFFCNRILRATILGVFLVCALVPVAYAQEAVSTPQVSAGDTAWVLTSSALVLVMIVPGLALFYGGMVRNKNVLSTMMHSFISICLVSVVWVLWGYSLAFGPDVGGIVGN